MGATAKKSPAATLLISTAFTAPLLPFAEIMSFGLNIYGGAKKGKSLALNAGGSVIGLGREEDLLTLGATTAAILEKAGPWTDLLFPINEVGTIKGKRSEAYAKLRELTFALNAGRDTVRHSSWGASGDPFRLIYAASAEHSTSEYAAMAGEKRDDGELVRLWTFQPLCERRTRFSPCYRKARAPRTRRVTSAPPVANAQVRLFLPIALPDAVQ